MLKAIIYLRTNTNQRRRRRVVELPTSLSAAMKASFSISAALVPLCAALVVPTAATATICNEAVFEASPSTVLTEEISSIYVGLANNCAGEGLFQMPRMT